MKLPKALGGSGNVATEIASIILGVDRALIRTPLEADGIQFTNNRNKLSYDALPDTVASFYRISNGQRKYIGQVCIPYEPMARLWSFETLNWVDETKINKKSVVLSTARNEAEAIVVQSIVKEDRFDRLSTALILAICLFGIIVLLYVIQSGVFAKIFS